MIDPTPRGDRAEPQTDAPVDPATADAARTDGASSATPTEDRTERLRPDGTVGSARPGTPAAPPATERPAPERPVPERPAARRPVVAPAQQLPLSPRRRARDEDAPPPVPVEQLPTSELSAQSAATPHPAPGAAPTAGAPVTPTPDAPAHPETTAVETPADEPTDLETTAEVPAAVVPRDVFDDAPPPRPAGTPPVPRPATGSGAEPAPQGEVQAPADGADDATTVSPLAWQDSPETRAWSTDDDGPRPPVAGGPGDTGARDPGDRDPGDRDPEQHGRSWWRGPALLAPVGLLVLLGVVYGADLAIAGDDVPRNTVVAGVDVGGMSPEDAAGVLTEQLAPRVTADHVLVADDVQGTLSPATAGITLDVDATVEAASGQPLNPWTRFTSLFGERDVVPVITDDGTALEAQVEQFAAGVDRAPSDATIALEGTTASVVPSVTGRTLDREGATRAVTEALASGGDPSTPIELPVETTDVLVREEQAQQTLDQTVTPALAAPITVIGDDGTTTAELTPEGIAGALVFTGQEDGTLAVTLDPAALQAAFGDQLGAFGTPAVDATFAVSGAAISVVPSTDGTGIDPAALAEQLLPVLSQAAPRQVTASLGPVPADFTTDEANALGVVEQISTFTTNFTSQASGTNIRVVAAEVDGALVLPGEEFSLNGYTGPRGEAEGYVPAGVINNGEFTQAVGGGISQFATTMFNAVFFAGLEDVFHKPHSYYISRYPAGREATVYYDSIDLRWRNDSPTGVYVQTLWTPNSLTVTFWGTQRFTIESVSSERYNVRSPVVQEKPDDGSCSPQGGSNGFDITVTRVFSDPATGAQVRTEDFQTRYAAEPVIRCVPVPPPAPESSVPAPPAQPTGRRPARAVLPGTTT